MTKTPTPAEIYALSQGSECRGDQECYWCRSACDRSHTHDERVIPFVKNTNKARCPSSPYVCNGCWLFSRTRYTIWHLGREDKEAGIPPFRDGQCLIKHSWLITPTESQAIIHASMLTLAKILLNPPLQFVLMLKEGKSETRLHQAVTANQAMGAKSDTPIPFTMNNSVYEYSVYELEQVVIGVEPVGLSAGTRELVKIIGMDNLRLLVTPKEDKKDAGRPKGSTTVIPNPGKRAVGGK